MELEGSDELVRAARDAARTIEQSGGPIRCVAHYDCDGIASAVTVDAALDRADLPYEITFVDELNAKVLAEVVEGAIADVFLFVDIGSGQIETIQDQLADRTVVIADHHDPGDGTVDVHVNPHTVGIDGGEHISGAGVTYLVARMLDEANRDLVKYALIGATGDMQLEDDTSLGLSAELMQDAEEMGVIERKKGLKLFGRNGKSLVKALKYTTDPYLPGITNDESGAVQFLSELGIDLKQDGEWRSLEDLSLDEEREIVHGLLTRGYDVASLLGDIYMLDNGWEIGEFASLLNACGRLEQPESGITICRDGDFDLAYTIKRRYGRKIGRYLSFVEDNMEDSEVVPRFEHGAMIIADDNIHANMIGTVTTICQKSDIVPGDVLVGMAEKGEDHLKLSARATDAAVADGLQVNDLMNELCTVCEGEGGGHEAAAGGKIPREEKDRFIKMMTEVLDAAPGEVDYDGQDRDAEAVV